MSKRAERRHHYQRLKEKRIRDNLATKKTKFQIVGGNVKMNGSLNTTE
jgi:hypothetical protein